MKRTPLRRSSPLPRGKPPKRKKRGVGTPKHLRKEWRALRLSRLELDGFRCQYGFDGCTGEATEVDHSDDEYGRGRGVKSLLVPLDKLRSTCRNCHKVRHPWLGTGFGLGSRERNARTDPPTSTAFLDAA